MSWEHPWGSLTQTRPVVVDGRTVFLIHYLSRNVDFGPDHAVHGVPETLVVDQYAEALKHAFGRLTSPEFGWADSSVVAGGERKPWNVAIQNLGPNFLGAALESGGTDPYLVLNSRSLYLPAPAARLRQAVAAHELVHLLQFGTPAYRYWPGTFGRVGEKRDPNWWLHEATALALEAELSEGLSVCGPLFWNWATVPEVSIDKEPAGTLAAPFLQYLTRRFGAGLLADAYRLSAQDVPDMRGTSLLEYALRKRGLTLASATGDDCFASGYCVDAAFAGDPGAVLPSELRTAVGPRALTDRFSRYPVSNSASGLSVQRLGCRYFELIPTRQSHWLQVCIRAGIPRSSDFLRGELVSVSCDGTRSRMTLTAHGEYELGGRIEFSPERVARAVLVIANCAYAPGCCDFYELPFEISAAVE